MGALAKAYSSIVAAHPKTSTAIAFGLGVALVPALKAIGWVF